MSGQKNLDKDAFFFHLIKLFDKFGDIQDNYYKNIEKEKLFQLISFVIFRDDVFDILNKLLIYRKANIAKSMEYIFYGKDEYSEDIKKYNKLKEKLFKLSGYQFMETENTLFDIYHLFEFNGNEFKIVYKPVKAFLDWSDTIETINYSNIPFSYKSQRIKALKTIDVFPDELNKKIVEFAKKIASPTSENKNLSLKDVKCFDLKRKLITVYLYKKVQQEYSVKTKNEQIKILINELNKINRELKKDLIRKCKMLREKINKNIVYEEACSLYNELKLFTNHSWLWHEINRYKNIINFYNGNGKQ
jgi:hypothetical protein